MYSEGDFYPNTICRSVVMKSSMLIPRFTGASLIGPVMNEVKNILEPNWVSKGTRTEGYRFFYAQSNKTKILFFLALNSQMMYLFCL